MGKKKLKFILFSMLAMASFVTFAFSPATHNFLVSFFTKTAFAVFSSDCTGGTITHSGGKTIHTFTSSGTFTCTGSGNVEVLVVAGGGGGGGVAGNSGGGGGGAGGYKYSSSFAVAAQAYTVTVGAGGNAGASPTNGGDSIFSTLTATGGGSGGKEGGPDAGNGGSGGGCPYQAGHQTPGTGISGQGYGGGYGYASSPYWSGAGGGGASAAGADGTSSTGGNGGAGIAFSISGSSVYYCGGGGGGQDNGTSGGTGGSSVGGNGAHNSTPATTPTVNSGSGGGGSSSGASSAGASGIVIVSYTTPSAPTNTNIDTTYHYAWSENIGWINFYSENNVNVLTAQLNGYASSSIGYVALDCATSPNGNICGTSNFKVLNDGSGNLSGWAYNDAIGWISFDSATAGSSYFYQVSINPSTGDFSGWAWNDNIGWISFNCSTDNSCGSSSYKVKTSWAATQTGGNLISSIFDTGAINGVALNTIMWQGSQPSGTTVKFQIASNFSLTGGGTGLIDSVYRYAWNDSIGWIDFGYSGGSVSVGTSQLTGYASSSIGYVALDCATSPAGNICASSNFKVARNNTTGDLSGYAWNDSIGWISFNCSDPGLCGTSNYKVNVNTANGAFTGYAWNDYVGWISVNCSDPGLCGSSDYRVNTVTAASWDFKGPDGSATTYYSPAGPGLPAQLNLQYNNNKRYFQYKIFLYSNPAQTTSPRVDDVIINYSP